VDQVEVEKLIGELETALDRLRSLYDQYFVGIERIEPGVARKDVDRRLYLLRKEQIRNTALRYRFQMVLQRYNTLQTYWQRICREIENGTYKRHLMRAQRRFGSSRPPRRRSSMLPPPEIRPEPGAPVSQELAAQLADLDKEFAPASVDVEISVDENHSSRPRPPSSPRPPTPGLPLPARPGPVPPRPATAAAPPVWKKVAPAVVPAVAPAQGGQPPKNQPGGPLPPGGQRPAPEGPQPAPRASPPSSSSRAPPPGAPGASVSPDGPPRASAPRPPAPESPQAPRARLASGPGASLPVPRPAEPVVPAVRPQPPRPSPSSPPPRPPSLVPPRPSPAPGELSEKRLRQIYVEYVDAKRRQNESTATITYQTVAKSLRESGEKLRHKHGKDVDFEVTIKDGKTILRPVLK
jgi:hypothetical protein